ncbi:ion transporter [Halorientalis brevis]|uniref:Ion transporter n=1 Tax=Halorientalis brevis TaxID=1126241 RepID=A0ABD6CI84_9EURY|nr:ion transporter [Halorientalis brevis]
MAGRDSHPDDRSLRELIRFYLIDHRTPIGKLVDVGVLVLDLVFIAIVVVETYPLTETAEAYLWLTEVTIASIFLVEYLLRLYSARNRWGEFTDPYTMVDLVSILPTFVVLAAPGLVASATAIGLLRLARVVRVLRFFRFTKDEQFFFGTVELGTLRAMKLLLTVLSIFFLYAGFFYNVEHAANPAIDTFGDAFYFAVVSLTTVGFGDITPVTRTGRWVTVSAILMGIILLPWEASRIIRAWTDDGTVDVTCPECGLTGHDPDASHCKACGNVIYQQIKSKR